MDDDPDIAIPPGSATPVDPIRQAVFELLNKLLDDRVNLDDACKIFIKDRHNVVEVEQEIANFNAATRSSHCVM